MKTLIFILAMLLTSVSYGESWIDFKHKTYVGGYYAAICTACIHGRYHNDNNGYWQCDGKERDIPTGMPEDTRSCIKGITDAFFGKEK